MTEVEQELAAAGQRIKELEEEIVDLKKNLAESKEQVKKLQKEKTDYEIEAVNLKEELEKVKVERDEIAAKANAAEEKLAMEDNKKENNKRNISDADQDLVESILLRAKADELEMGKVMELMSNAEALSPEDKKKMEDLQNKVEHLEEQLELAKETVVICEAQTKEAEKSVDLIREKVIGAKDLNVLRRIIFKQDDSDTEEEKKLERKFERRNSTVNNSFVDLGEKINALSKDLNLSEEKERITSLIELFKKLGKPATPLVTPLTLETNKPTKVSTEPEEKEEVPSLLVLSEQPEQIEDVETFKTADNVEETSKTADSEDAEAGSRPTSTKRVRFSQMDEDFNEDFKAVQLLEDENEGIYTNTNASSDDEAGGKDSDDMYRPDDDL